MKINRCIKKINKFLASNNRRSVSKNCSISYKHDDHDKFHKKKELLSVYLDSAYLSDSLLKKGKELGYKSQEVNSSFIRECDFQIEYITLLLNTCFKESELPSLGIPLSRLITYYKRINDQNSVIDLCDQAINLNISYKYMDFDKEKKLAKFRLNKQNLLSD